MLDGTFNRQIPALKAWMPWGKSRHLDSEHIFLRDRTTASLNRQLHGERYSFSAEILYFGTGSQSGLNLGLWFKNLLEIIDR
jgi:hypothetical protein